MFIADADAEAAKVRPDQVDVRPLLAGNLQRAALAGVQCPVARAARSASGRGEGLART